MAKRAVFTMKLERELKDEFVQATYQAKRYASAVVRELMREYIRRQEDEAYYRDYIRRRVLAARAMATDGEILPDDEVARLYMLKEAERDNEEDIQFKVGPNEPLRGGEGRVEAIESDYLLDETSGR